MNAKKRRIFDIIQIGYDGDFPSRAFDITIVILILINLFIAIFETFDVSANYKGIIGIVELITVLAFTVEYILRLWTSDYLYPYDSKGKSLLKYMFSFNGIIDLLAFFPYYLPFFFPAGVVAFRIFRVMRILRLFQVNAYYDALNVIVDVIKGKKNQLLSSIFIILILMMASSLCMYSLEHEAQPDIFRNAFSGLWWSVSTLLTVGYGDIYPVTIMGRVFAIVISFLGVLMVAIPTGLLSAGFVEYYTKVKSMGDYYRERDIQFVRFEIGADHPWIGETIGELMVPKGMYVALIKRAGKILAPRKGVKIMEGDQLVMGGEGCQDPNAIALKEIELKEHHPWVGQEIGELDISRQSMVVMLRRDGKVIVPNGQTVLEIGDQVVFYSKRAFLDAHELKL